MSSIMKSSTKPPAKEEPKNYVSILQYIMSGAWFQTEDQIDLGIRNSKECKLCGEDEDNIIHTLWDCKKLHEGEMCSRLKGLCKNDIPRNLQIGIPSPMDKSINKTFFGKKFYDLETKDATIQKMMGVETEGKFRAQNDLSQDMAERTFQRADGHNAEQNLRQAFARAKGGTPDPMVPNIKQCNEEAPSNINVYTDGSLINNKASRFELGAAGV